MSQPPHPVRCRLEREGSVVADSVALRCGRRPTYFPPRNTQRLFNVESSDPVQP
jgi:hypothetical protein